MQYRKLGKTGINASVVVFGGIMLNASDASFAKQRVVKAIEEGINYFDVAPSYGDAQHMLGPALKPYRKDVYLACKTLKRSAAIKCMLLTSRMSWNKFLHREVLWKL